MTPSATSEHNSGWLDSSSIPMSFVACWRPSLTEVPSLRRSYPASSVLRTSPPPHTARPVSRELPVDPYRDLRWGFPCCVWSPRRTCHRHYPGRFDGACSLVSLHRRRPSLCNSQVGSCNYCFGACSAFTHVMACTLAESPMRPFPSKARHSSATMAKSQGFSVSSCRSRTKVSVRRSDPLPYGYANDCSSPEKFK